MVPIAAVASAEVLTAADHVAVEASAVEVKDTVEVVTAEVVTAVVVDTATEVIGRSKNQSSNSLTSAFDIFCTSLIDLR